MEVNVSNKATNKPLEESVTYQVQDRKFVVEPVFSQNGKETLGNVLLRLMKSDMTKS